MLDLVKMNREATLPNALRRRWMLQTGHDPLKCRKRGSLFVVSFALSLLLVIVGGSFTIEFLRHWLPLTCLIIGIFGTVIFFLLARVNDSSALEFIDAIEFLSGEDPGISGILPALLKDYSITDLSQRAEEKLGVVIREILDLQDRSQETNAQEIRSKRLRPLHQAMWKLGLVDQTCDRYFRIERKVFHKSE